MRGRVGSAMVTAALAALAFALTVGVPAAQAANTFHVNSNVDLHDTNPGDGSCHASNGRCTLRAAVQEADKQGGTWLITVPRGTFPLSLAPRDEDKAKGGDLDVTFDGKIAGAGATKTVVRIDRTKVKDRVFDVLGTPTVTLAAMTIAGGDVTATATDTEAGGVATDTGSTVTLLHDVIKGNRAANSGGAVSAGGTLFVTGTLIADNHSGNNGGAIRSYGDVTVVASTLSGNIADGGAGAIDPNEDVTVRNSTVEGNTGGSAGGIGGSGGTYTISSSTFAGNAGAGGGNIQGAATITNTILADAPDGDCTDTIQATNSLIDDTTGCTVLGTGNVTDQPAKLGPLQANGGPTPTMALLTGSPARDAGDVAACPTTDQRGVHRPQGAGCDMGAYEVPFPHVTKPSAAAVHQATFTAAWLVPGGGPAAKFFSVRYRDRPIGQPQFGSFHSLLDHTTARHTPFTAMFGFEYCFSASAFDAGGNHSPFGPEHCAKVTH